MKRRRKRDERTGFTLMELLLAITLFSIVAVAIYSSLAIGIKVHKRTASLGSEYRDIRLLFDLIKRDIANAVSMNKIYLKEESQKISFLSSQEVIGGAREIFKITYNWEMEDDYFRIMRLKENYIDSLKELHKQGEEVFDKIKKVDFSYGYIKKTLMKEKSFSWKEGWKEEGLPKMVKVILETDKGSFQEIIYCPSGKLVEIKEV